MKAHIHRFVIYIVIALVCGAVHLHANGSPKIVTVGVYPFFPYVVYTNNQITGVTQDFLSLLNKHQSEYQFIAKEVSTKRRYREIEKGKIDLMFFEDKEWGWAGRDVSFSNYFFLNGKQYRDADLYVALKDSVRDQSYFNDLTNKELLLTLGYHYGFAGYNSDMEYLKKHFHVSFSEFPENVIDKLIAKRGDIALMTESILRSYIAKNPRNKDLFLVSEKKDGISDVMIVIGKNSVISKEKINTYIAEVEKSGELYALFKKYNLVD